MSFNNKPGFTLVEVMIALAIMGIMFVSIFSLQASLTRSVIWMTQRFERIVHAHNFLMESAALDEQTTDEKEAITRTKKITRPPTELHYKKSKITSDKPFGDVSALYKQQVTISWQDGKQKRNNRLISYVYQPKKTQETKEKQVPVTPQPPAPGGPV